MNPFIDLKPLIDADAALQTAIDGKSDLGHSHTTSEITSASVSFEIDSHPFVNGRYNIWDLELTTGRFRWASDAAYAGGANWTALRWNPSTSRWELGTYTAFTTWTPLFYNPTPSDIPLATGWQAITPLPEGTIFVSGAGTPAANGPYTPTGTLFGTPPRPTYTGPNDFSILWNGLYWIIQQGSNAYYFNGVQFEDAPTPDLVAAWTRTGSGTDPAPAVTLPPPPPTLQWSQQGTDAEILDLHAKASRLQKQLDDQGGINTAAIQTLSENTTTALATETSARQAADQSLSEQLAATATALTTDLATLESSLGTLSQQNADAASITGGTANFDSLEAGTEHAANEGTLTISAAGDILGSGTNRLLGFIAGGATY